MHVTIQKNSPTYPDKLGLVAIGNVVMISNEILGGGLTDAEDQYFLVTGIEPPQEDFVYVVRLTTGVAWLLEEGTPCRVVRASVEIEDTP